MSLPHRKERRELYSEPTWCRLGLLPREDLKIVPGGAAQLLGFTRTGSSWTIALPGNGRPGPHMERQSGAHLDT